MGGAGEVAQIAAERAGPAALVEALLEFGRAEVLKGRVPAAGVVEAFDVPEQAHPGGLAGREALAPKELLLQAGEEGLGERVVGA
jgi:hypothetical protein